MCVIVLNYNGRSRLEYCLPSILETEYPSFLTVVVDNASSDDSVDFVRRRYPEVVVLTSHRNRGWSGGNNLGIGCARQWGAEYVLLANNDIRVDRRWVRAAVDVAERDSRVGIVGFRILEPRADDPDAGFMRAVAEWPGLEVKEPRWVDGMAMFVRTKVFDAIGMIDEGFFMYAEDNDLELRARKAGFRILATNVPVWHGGQVHCERIPLWASAMQIRHDLRLSIKHDDLGGVAYQVARHLAKACLPFIHVDRRDPVARRLRPSNIFVNFGLFVYAVTWNLLHLRGTLRRRHEDAARIQSARGQLGLG